MAEPETQKIEDTEMPELELSLKKKKKKKSAKLLDEEIEEAPSAPPTEASEAAGDGDEPLLDLSTKKKKKKKKNEDLIDQVDEKPASAEEEEQQQQPESAIVDLEGKKKKKSKQIEDGEAGEDGADTAEGGKNADDEEEVQVQDRDVEIDIDEEVEEETKIFEDFDEAQWQTNDKDYQYEDMLRRMYSQLRAKNPELSGGRKKYKMKVPQVLRDGSKKTVFGNFQAICDSLNRNHEHLLNFVLVELGTSGSLDASNRLTIKGRYPPKHIENLIRRYVTEFVICGMCKSLDTVLERDPNTRLYVLKCSNCRATRTVTAVKQGFMAQIGKRPKT